MIIRKRLLYFFNKWLARWEKFISEALPPVDDGLRTSSLVGRIIVSELFVVIAVLLVLTPQIRHSFHLYYQNSMEKDQVEWIAWSYALGVDMAILIFTFCGWVRLALFYALTTFIGNNIYHFVTVGPEAKIFIDFMVSSCLYFFSHVVVSLRSSGAKKEDNEFALIGEYFKPALDHGVPMKLNPHVCPECGASFHKANQLNAHITDHKKKGEWRDDYGDDWQDENKKREQWCLDNYGGLELVLDN